MKIQINLAILLAMFFSIEMVGQKVGINTTNPIIELDVRSTDDNEAATMRVSNPSESRFLEFYSGSSQYPEPVIFWPGTQSILFATNENTFTEWMRITNAGKVGIGTNNPEAKLDIIGGDWNLDAGNPGDLRIGNSTYNFRIGVATGGGGAGLTRMYSQGNSLFLGTNNRPSIAIGQNENIGIGTTNTEARVTINSFGLSDTLLLLKNTTTIGAVDYGIHFDDESANATIGAFFNTDSTAIVAQTDCIGCDLISASGNGVTGSGRAIFGKNNSADGLGVQGTNTSPSGTAIKGLVSNSGAGSGVGVWGESNASSGTGVYGVGNKEGVFGFSPDDYSFGYGVRGKAAGSNAIGVYGRATGSSGIGVAGDGIIIGVRGIGEIGVKAHSSSSSGIGLDAVNFSNSGFTIGVKSTVYSADGIGVQGTGPKTGIYGFSNAVNPDGYGVWGLAAGEDGQGLRGEATGSSGIGVYGEGNTGIMALSNSSSGIGLDAVNFSNTGFTIGIKSSVYSADGIGVQGTGPKTGVYGFSNAVNPNGYGVWGLASGIDGQGLRGKATGTYGKALYAEITSDHSSANAILAQSGGGNSYAAYLIGKVHVSGVLSKSSGSFKIDHPLDPENKYLSHSFVESPDMMNIYNGNIMTDNKGNAIVTLPDYFQALNMEFRYQLTVIGEFAQAIIKEKINVNTFKIMTDKPNIEVSWQVTGVRKDAFAEKNRIKVEEEKETTNKGKYLNPTAFGQTKEKGIGRSE